MTVHVRDPHAPTQTTPACGAVRDVTDLGIPITYTCDEPAGHHGAHRCPHGNGTFGWSAPSKGRRK